MKRIAGRSCQNFAPRLIRQPLVNFPDPPATSHQRTSRQPLAIARARPDQILDPPPAGARFTVPDPRSAASWARSSAPDPPAAGLDPPPAGRVFCAGAPAYRVKKHGF